HLDIIRVQLHAHVVQAEPLTRNPCSATAGKAIEHFAGSRIGDGATGAGRAPVEGSYGVGIAIWSVCHAVRPSRLSDLVSTSTSGHGSGILILQSLHHPHERQPTRPAIAPGTGASTQTALDKLRWIAVPCNEMSSIFASHPRSFIRGDT